KDTMNNDANALSFVTDVRITISTMLSSTRTEMVRMLMCIFRFFTGFPVRIFQIFLFKQLITEVK
ncbi:MAG TPA: hypothetical protein DEP22_06290, partial [Porphyromonadaceae bacterium]|nr:hypothetical protein [Porphyromonadaceae bacterium]